MHNLYGQAWEMMNDKQDDKDMPAPDDGGGSDDEGLCGHGEDSAAESEHEEHQVVAVDEADAVDMVEFELEDVAPEASSFKRQSTYHGNTRAWLRTQPLRRIWVLVEVHRVQQDTQKAMLKQVGAQWEEREFKNRLRGGQPQFRVVQAYNCELQTKALRRYAAVATSEQHWENWPNQFKSHDMAMLTYRSSAASAAAEFQLQKVRQRHYPFVAFGIIDASPKELELLTLRIEADYLLTPCVLDIFFRMFFGRLKGVNLLEYLRSSEFKHIIVFLAEHAEWENGTVEANNALLRRRIRQAIQSRKVDVKDLSCHWVISAGRAEANAITGDDTIKELSLAPVQDAKKMRGGGGGMYRAYIHRFKDDHRLPSGRLDFATLTRMYNAEKAMGDASVVLNDLRESARRATAACKAAFRVHEKKRGSYLTRFGVVKSDGVKRVRMAAENRMLLTDIDLGFGRLCNAAGSESLAVALRQQAFLDIVAVKAPDGLADKVRILNRLCRLQGLQEARARAADRRQTKVALSEPASCPVLDLTKLNLPKDGVLRSLPGPLPRLLWVDPCLKHGLRRVAAMNKKHEDLGPPLEKAWDHHHKVTPASCLPKPPELPAALRQTLCWQHGFGRCLCNGVGLLLCGCGAISTESCAALRRREVR